MASLLSDYTTVLKLLLSAVSACAKARASNLLSSSPWITPVEFVAEDLYSTSRLSKSARVGSHALGLRESNSVAGRNPKEAQNEQGEIW